MLVLNEQFYEQFLLRSAFTDYFIHIWFFLNLFGSAFYFCCCLKYFKILTPRIHNIQGYSMDTTSKHLKLLKVLGQ